MTICIAGLFRWNYAGIAGGQDWGPAALLIADRMITAGDSQYEPLQQKAAQITPYTTILIAGDYSTHSQALINTARQVPRDSSRSPYAIAQIYARALQEIKQRRAEDEILVPLGLNSETFIAQQKEMSEGFIDRITLQLQSFEGPDVEAIVVGFDKESDRARLYEINTKGTVHCFDDIGFCAIGSGAWHARARLMQARYVSSWNLALAVTALYAAKKDTEAAPGVGKTTDVHMILRDGAGVFWPHVVQHLDKLLNEYNEQNTALVRNAVLNLQAYLDDPKNYPQALPPAPRPDEKPERIADSSTARRSIETSAQHAPEGSDQLQGKEP